MSRFYSGRSRVLDKCVFRAAKKKTPEYVWAEYDTTDTTDTTEASICIMEGFCHLRKIEGAPQLLLVAYK